MKYFGIIFKLAVHVVCVVHMITILRASLYPEEASIRVYQKNLSGIELPVVFQICLIENLGGADRTKKLGYKDMKHFNKLYILLEMYSILLYSNMLPFLIMIIIHQKTLITLIDNQNSCPYMIHTFVSIPYNVCK